MKNSCLKLTAKFGSFIKKRWAIWSLFVLLSSPLPSRAQQGATLSSLETQVRTIVRDLSSDSNYQRWTNSQIDAYLNEAARDFQNRTWAYYGTFNISLNSGQPEYVLPSDFIAIMRVTVASAAIQQVTFAGLDGGGGGQSYNQAYGTTMTNWTVTTSTPTAWYLDEYVFNSPPQIGFFPTPSTTSVNSVFVQYIRQVPVMVNETDVPFGGNSELQPYVDALADFAAARLWQLLGRSDQSTFLMSLYGSRADAARANLNKMPAFQPGIIGNRGPKQ